MPTVRNLGATGLRETGAPKQPFFRMGDARLTSEWPAVMQFALDRVLSVFFRNNMPVIMTSVWREPAKSKEFSLHGFGFAFDVDTDRELRQQVWLMLKEQVQAEIGKEFQVIVHDVGSGLHMHIEFDPQDDKAWQELKAEFKAHWSVLRQKATEPHEHELG